jgi:uncharacterized membrane protein YjjP (DUF1212 family)
MNTQEKLENISNLILDIASLLMMSGANTNRVHLNINRFASVLNCEVYSFISHKTIILTITDSETKEAYTRVKNIPPHRINFSTIASISKASWNAISEDWSIEQIQAELKRIKEQKRYPRIVVLIAVSFAGMGFCNIFGGDYINMIVAFISTFAGVFIHQFTHTKRYNVYLSVFLASFIASTLASLGVVYNLGTDPQTALATSVLFLVPGVALINSFTDFLDGNFLIGLVRSTHGFMTVLAIALGLFSAMILFSIKFIG